MITYGIVSDGNNAAQLNTVIQSIHWCMHDHHPDDWEIIVVGPFNSDKAKGCRVIPFFSERGGWITKKKNMITEFAQYDTIVYLHDYIEFERFWFNNWLKFSLNNEWDIGMNVLLTQDGQRFRDWCAWDDPRHGYPWIQKEPWCPPEGVANLGKPCLVPYDYTHTERMYISGTFWLAKKHVMVDNPLDESLFWGQAEDIEWSRRVRNRYKYVMNTQSVCRLLKPKDVILPYVELNNE